MPRQTPRPSGPARPAGPVLTPAAGMPPPASRPPVARPVTPSAMAPAPGPIGPSLSIPQIWLIGGLAVVAYYLYGGVSKGFYQQDEAAHYLSMLDFWHDPKAILGNWAKWGYKLLYVTPALAGASVVKAINAGFAALSAILVALSLRRLGNPLLLAGLVLALAQPLWVSLSFRNYSEIPSAFLLVGAYYAHLRGRHALAMLALSYLCTIRQEFYPILALYGLDALYRRRWLAVLVAPLFPLLQNVYGFYFHGDPLYLVNQLAGGSGAASDAWPRQGLDHYALTSMVVFGPVAVGLLVYHLFSGLIDRGWRGAFALPNPSTTRAEVDSATPSSPYPDPYLIIPILVFFGIQSLFNWQAVTVGPSTGGNLRYMLVISPLVAIAAAQGLWHLYRQPPTARWRALYVLGPLILLTIIFLNYKNNLTRLTDDRDPVPALILTLAVALALFSRQRALLEGGLVALCGLVLLLQVRPLPLSEEDRTMRSLADWYRKNEATYRDRPLHVNHVMFFYYLERTRTDFPVPPGFISDKTAAEAPAGALFLWDSHYGYRPKVNPHTVNYDYFTGRPAAFRFSHQLIATDESFGVYIFEKTTGPYDPENPPPAVTTP